MDEASNKGDFDTKSAIEIKIPRRELALEYHVEPSDPSYLTGRIDALQDAVQILSNNGITYESRTEDPGDRVDRDGRPIGARIVFSFDPNDRFFKARGIGPIERLGSEIYWLRTMDGTEEERLAQSAKIKGIIDGYKTESVELRSK